MTDYYNDSIVQRTIQDSNILRCLYEQKVEVRGFTISNSFISFPFQQSMYIMPKIAQSCLCMLQKRRRWKGQLNSRNTEWVNWNNEKGQKRTHKLSCLG